MGDADVAKRGKRRKNESPRYQEIQLLNRVTGEVIRQLLARTRHASAGAGGSIGTAGWLAGGVGVSESTLSRLLSGSNSPAFETIWFAAEALGLRPTQLVAVIEYAMGRIQRLEVSPSELVEGLASGAMTEAELTALLDRELAAAIDNSEREVELWELVPEDGATGPDSGGGSRWSRMLGSSLGASVVGTVLGAAAGVAAARFFGGEDDDPA